MVLAVGLLAGHVSVSLVLAAMLLLGVADVFSNTTAGTLLPMLVDKDMLAILMYRRLEQRWPLANIMRGCLTLEVCTHLSLALDTKGWIAMIIRFVFGAYAFV